MSAQVSRAPSPRTRRAAARHEEIRAYEEYLTRIAEDRDAIRAYAARMDRDWQDGASTHADPWALALGRR